MVREEYRLAHKTQTYGNAGAHEGLNGGRIPSSPTRTPQERKGREREHLWPGTLPPTPGQHRKKRGDLSFQRSCLFEPQDKFAAEDSNALGAGVAIPANGRELARPNKLRDSDYRMPRGGLALMAGKKDPVWYDNRKRFAVSEEA